MTDPVDTDALRDMANDNLRIGTWHGQVTAALYAAADEVDRLRHVRDAWKSSTEENSRKYQDLRSVIENAPHGFSQDGRQCELLWSGRNAKCTCWKADAL